MFTGERDFGPCHVVLNGQLESEKDSIFLLENELASQFQSECKPKGSKINS